MALDLKTMLNDVLAQSAFLQRASFTNSPDPDDIQMVAIANRVASEIRDMYLWGDLRGTFKVTMITDQTRYSMPQDFRQLVPDSAWEEDGSRRLELPVPDARWFLYKHTVFSDGGTIRARFYGKEIEIHDPEGGEAFLLEYISNWIIADKDGAVKERFTEDTDIFRLEGEDQLFTLGVQAHWAQAKRLPQYPEWFANYQNKLREAIGRDVGSRTIGGKVREIDWMKSRSPYTPTYVS